MAEQVSARFVLHCRERDTAVVAAALGVTLPTEPLRAASGGAVSALRLGPEEWLLLGDVDAGSRPNVAHSLVEVSHRQVAVIVAGPQAEQLLASGCPLDLALAKFPVGACTRTRFGKAQVILWRVAPDRFHMEVWRSFSAYVRLLLRQAEADI